MRPKTVIIAQDTAWCELCVDHNHEQDIACIDGLTTRGTASEVTRARGVIFWTPLASLEDMPVYIRWAILFREQARRFYPVSVEQIRRITRDYNITAISVDVIH